MKEINFAEFKLKPISPRKLISSQLHSFPEHKSQQHTSGEHSDKSDKRK